MSKHFPQLNTLHGNALFLGPWSKAKQYILWSVWEKEQEFFPALLCKQSNYCHAPEKTFQLWKVPQEKFGGIKCLSSILLGDYFPPTALPRQIIDPSWKSPTALNSRCGS